MLLMWVDVFGNLLPVFGDMEDAGNMVNSDTNLPHIFVVSTDVDVN